MKRKSYSGFTLMELLVAISLGLFVSTLIFAAFTGVFKGFGAQAQRADRIRTMVQIKQKLDRSFRTADVLTAVSTRKLAYTERGNPAEHTLTFHNNTIYRDNTVLESNVRDFTFTASDERTEQGFRLVRWEALLDRGGWVGGVAVLQGKADNH